MIPQHKADEQPITRPGRLTGRGISSVSVVSKQYWEKLCFHTENPLLGLPDVEKVLNSIAQNEIDQSLTGLGLL